MSKKVLTHWVEMETIIVPDDCPTDSYNNMIQYLDDTGLVITDLIDKHDTRDYEIVQVDNIPTQTTSPQMLDTMLRESKEPLEFFILLNGGIRSSKRILFDVDHYWLFNNIDDTEEDYQTLQQMLDHTNIGEAITKGAFYKHSL